MSDSSPLNVIEQVDADYVECASALPLADAAAFRNTDHIAMRQWLADVYTKFPSEPQVKRIRTKADVKIANVSISYGNGNGFSVRIYDPSSEDGQKQRPALLMFHGGGWIHGVPQMDEGMATFLASELDAVVINVDYRLAPEFPFPAPRDDAYEALNWTVENATAYNIDVARIGVWGVSAGANIAASIALQDSTEHEVSRIRHMNLVVPVTCHPDLYPAALRSESGSMQRYPFGGDAAGGNAALKRLWTLYLGSNIGDKRASVLLATPPPNHSPLHITVGGTDGLRDEGIAYALLLRNAGIDAQLEIIPGVPHGITVSPSAFVAQQFVRNQVRLLNYALNYKC
ncbi:alpha/beta hydrolase domain-containing protein [Halenospora varia]|nr:alpha/beta hydrolase domain-containing protein [Halenospora varia]